MALANGGNNSIIADNDHSEDVACGWWGRGAAISLVKYISFYGQVVLLLLLVSYFHGVVCLQCSL